MQRRTFLRNAALLALASGLPHQAWADAGMRRRTVASTGEEIPVVGFGTWQTFDVDPDDAEALDRLRRVLVILFEHGGAVIDASPMYGRAEAVVGRLLESDTLARDDAFLATKVWTRGAEQGGRQIDASARLMANGGMIDLMQIHNLVDWRTHLATLRALKSEGRIRHIGLTHYTDAGVDELIDVLEREEDIDFVQCAYSLGVRKAERRLFPLCAERGVGVIVNRPFEGGAAFRRTRGVDVPGWAREGFAATTWARFFLKFVLGDPRVTCVIPGTGKVEHARDNVQAGFGPLPDADDRARMVALWRELR